MANTKSAIKYIRKTEVRTAHNRSVKNRLRSLKRKLEQTLAGDDASAKQEAAKTYLAALDKAAKTGVVHRNLANRHKSRFASVLFASE